MAGAVPELGLARKLGAWDGCFITIGAIVGTGIFLTPGDVARALVPSFGSPVGASAAVLAVWIAGGLLTVAGALTYAELGTMFPRAGGIYHFLKEAYGPLVGFLYGWTAWLVIMSGGIAALAAGFAEYLARLLPFVASDGPGQLGQARQQVVAAAAIIALTAVNHFGIGPGALVQRSLTVIVMSALLVFGVLGLALAVPHGPPAAVPPPEVPGTPSSPMPAAGLAAAMVAVLWTYDGWYGLVFSAGEMRRPERDLPRALIAGTAVAAGLYVVANAAFLRALSPAGLTSTARVGEAAASAFLGGPAARAATLVILVTILGCLATTILYSSRIYLPMARDGVFFAAGATVHPRYLTPTFGLWTQSLWAAALALTGTYRQLYTFAVFAGILFHVATGAAVIVLRRTRPDLPRPYRVWGYPVVPGLFLGASLLLVLSTLVEQPRESVAGLALVGLGVPAFMWWRRRR